MNEVNNTELHSISVLKKILVNILRHKLLLLILLLAFILRIYDINENPRAMYGDSLTLVYDAYSILKTGRDQTGQFLPLFFSMGGGRPAGYIYATIPFTYFFGPTPLASRSVSILSGVGVTLLLYLICSKILSKKIGLFASFLSAITPWELSLSRGAFETHFALFLSLLGLFFFLKAKDKKNWLLLSGLSFALAMQTYSTYVITIPLFVFILLIIEFFNKPRKRLINWQHELFLFLISASFLFSAYISVSKGDKDRFSNILVFNQPEIENYVSSKVSAERAYSLSNPGTSKIFHNYVIESFNVLMENYSKSFGIEFLFLKGDKNPRHNPASMGELYWVNLPLIIFGLIFLYSKFRKVLLLLLLWVLVSPIAATLVGPPHALRSSFMLPALIILSASGLTLLKKSTTLIIIMIFFLQLPLFLERFYLLSPKLNSSFWSYSAKKATEYVQANRKSWDFIILSTSVPDMEFAYPVYSKIDPNQVIFQNYHKSFIGQYSFLKYDNVYLGSIPNGDIKKVMDSLNGSVFYIGPIEDVGHVDNEKIVRDEAKMPLYITSTKPKQLWYPK